jgi:acyl carrier protein
MDEEQKKVLNIISRKLGIPVAELHLDADLKTDLNAQDIEIADLLMEIEKEFDYHFSPEEVLQIHSIGDLVDLVSSA